MILIFKRAYKALDTHLPKFFKIFIPVLLGMALLLLLLPNSYWANDNVGIINVIKLGYTTSFMAAILGKFLSLFYLHIGNDFPWYAVFLYLIHGLSITLFIYSITMIISNKRYQLLLLILYLVIYSVMVLKLGYNGASIMIGANSLFLFCCYLRISSNVKIHIIVLLGFAFSLSYLVRTRGTYAIIIFSFPAVLFYFLHMKNRKYWYPLLFLLPAILLMGLNNYYIANFTSSKYKEYSAYNKIRGKIHDFPIAKANIDNETLFMVNNWSKNDYMAFISWFFMDEDTYSKEKISNIFKYSVTNDEMSFSFINTISKIGACCSFYSSFLMILMLILLAIAYYSSRKTMIMSVFYSIYCLGGILYLSVFYRFPKRIGIPIFLLIYSYLILIFLIHKYDHAGDANIDYAQLKSEFRRSLYLSYTVILILGIFSLVSNIKYIPFKQSEVHNIVESVNKLPSNSIVIFQPAWGLEEVCSSPLVNLPIKNDLNIITGGWHIFSERYYHQIRQAGAKEGEALLPFLLKSGRLHLVAANNRFKLCVATYYQEHYKLSTYWRKVGDVAGRTIYRIEPRENIVRNSQNIQKQTGTPKSAPVRKSDKTPEKRRNLKSNKRVVKRKRER